MFSDCCTICQTPASGFGLKSADQALRAPRARPLSGLEKSYSIAREMPAVPWSCRIRRTRILLLFSGNLERFARQTRLSSENRLSQAREVIMRAFIGRLAHPEPGFDVNDATQSPDTDKAFFVPPTKVS